MEKWGRYLWLFFLLACEPGSPLKKKPDTSTVIPPIITTTADKANFLVLTNTGKATSGEITIRFPQNAGPPNTEQKNIQREKAALAGAEPIPRHAVLPEPPALIAADPSGPSFARGDSASYNVDGTETFNVKTGSNFTNKTFTLKKKVEDTHHGWQVHYWVDPTVYEESNTSEKDNKIGSAYIEKMASKFSDPNTTADILGASIAIFGAPWGYHEYANLIPANTRDIHILFYDIAGDAYVQGQSRILGYFYNRDNITRDNSKNSNQKLVINMDSPVASRFPQQSLATLIHEFQHMIHYYQKSVKLAAGLRSETWLDEMLAEAAVDLVARKLSLPVNNDRRIMGYLATPYDSLTKWDGKTTDYYSVAAFGAYLLRHYANNSAGLARKILQNRFLDYRAITTATGKEWKEIIKGWGKQTLSGYRATSDLPAINFWSFRLLPLPKILGIPMFQPGSKNGYIFRKDGSYRLSLANYNYPSKFPGPGAHVFYYLGRSAKNVELVLPEGIDYENVSFP